MWHICTKTNTKWNCTCGSRCGYPKNGTCLFHRELEEHPVLDYSLLAHIANHMDEICEDGKVEFGRIISKKFYEISKEELSFMRLEN